MLLCGKCTEVCPIGIDGRDYILKLRRENVREAEGTFREKGYGMLLKKRKIISIKIIVMQLGNASFSQGVIFLLFIQRQ